jgi:hypothetical protein
MQASGVRVNTVLTTAAAEAVTASLCLGRAAGQRLGILQGSAGQPPHTAYLARLTGIRKEGRQPASLPQYHLVSSQRYQLLHTFREFFGGFESYTNGNLLHAGFLLAVFFDPEGGGDMFIRHIGWLSTDYTALCPRRYNSFRQLFRLLSR